MTVTSPALVRSDQPIRRPLGPRLSKSTRSLVVKILVALVLLIELYPLFWILMNSFKSQFEFLNSPLTSLPTEFHWENYTQAWTTGHLGRNALNSVLVTFPSLAVIILMGAAAGFALEVMIWKGRNTVLLFIIGGIMVPLQIILLPLFTIYYKVGLSGTYWPLIITYIGHSLPLAIFLFATYFRAVPKELFEAVAIDGGGPFRAFFSVALPVVRNGIFTVALLMFFTVWNDLLIALTFNIHNDKATIQVGLLHFNDEYGGTSYGPLFAAISTTVFATLAVYLSINQQVMRGMTAGSVKG
ncbi:MAG: carbohydrate ABC transporter permease [Propionibacteriaceae bacterium]|jgi:raffinose/stachyose/melibiose transport system permease protein|nr:carbohydrate ABC transporter permease [Propionibacteriaceae bacterium]